MSRQAADIRSVAVSHRRDLARGFSSELKQTGQLNEFVISIHVRRSMTNHPNFQSTLQPMRDWRVNAQLRIDAQQQIIAKLKPGSDAHRASVQVLLLLQDSLHVLSETDELLVRLAEQNKRRR